MTKQEKISILKKIVIFESLSESDFDKVADKVDYITVEPDSMIIRENMHADAFYIIIEGEVEILKEGEVGQLERLALKRPYDVFGEMSIIDELPRSASIKSKTAVKLFRIARADFIGILKEYSQVSFEVARTVCNTVRNTNDTYIINLEQRNRALEAAYSKLQQTQNELIRSEKLSVIGKFASLIIHDIKNPLTNIRAYSELIGLTIPDNQKIAKCTGIIIKEVDRLTNMTSELLEFARGEMKLNKTPVNFYSYIAILVDTIKADLANRNIEIIINNTSEDLIVNIDSEKMKRVFFNLIGNACDAIESNGTITIDISNDEKDALWVIKDTGCGMSEETVSRIFEPFYTKKQKGTGLGMAIVKGIIDNHAGKIKIDSKLGVGTKFTISLPKAL